jgi:hypothetical protein
VNDLPWFRLYTTFAKHPLVQMLSFDDQRHLVVVWCLKRKGILDKEYVSAELRSRVICAELGLDPVAAGEVNRRIRELGLIDENWQPSNWDEKQPISDSSTARVRKHRAKRSGNGDETLHDRFSNGPDREGEVDTEVEEEGEPQTSGTAESSPLEPAQARADDDFRLTPEREPEPDAPAKTATNAKTAQRGSRLPKPWDLTPERRKYAQQQGIDPDRTHTKFCNHWWAKTGRDAYKLDWDATWQNWCLGDAEKRPSRFRQPDQLRAHREFGK